MDKIELWPKDVYDANLRELISGRSPEMSLAKMTEEAFALLHAEDESTPKAAVTAAMNPLYTHSK